MTRHMSDISEDELSPTQQMSVFDLHHTMDDAERAFEVGSQIASTLSTASGTPTAGGSVHVCSCECSGQLINMLDGPGGEEPQTSSDEIMEAASQRPLRYNNAEMCEVSDPEEWMVFHHGDGGDSDQS